MAAFGGRNLIVLSDGTGNSAAKSAKTNVWRLYQALDLTDGRQVAVFGDGVGTSSVKILRVLGLALGVGVKRNVLNLYKFLCRNYGEDDRIWAFGFSRGAYTIRVLVGLVDREGLVTYKTEAELERNAIAAYRAFRKQAFATRIPWVRAGRYLRDRLVSLWNTITGARPYEQVRTETRSAGRDRVQVHFVGVWDTVAAYGLPIDELTQAVDKWVWPMSFRDRSLLANVGHARQALSLDDERRTFFPIPWDEKAEAVLREKDKRIQPDRLRQVWFAGAHADVGGGYPDDGLAYVPLCWMIDEAKEKGLDFEPAVVGEYVALAAPTGRIYDPRAGFFGAFWRYQPRDVQLLMGKGITPVVHGSVMTRMVCGNDRYAPISLPQDIAVLPPYGQSVAFEQSAVRQALCEANAALAVSGQNRRKGEDQRKVLTHMMALVGAALAPRVRADRFNLVLDTVWWRRVIYFVSLFLVTFAAAFPLLAEYLQIEGVADLNDRAGGSVGWAVGLVKGFLPGIAEPWTAAIMRNPAVAVLVVLGLLASLRFSSRLQGRICDRARAAWNCDAARAAHNVGQRAGASPVDRLQLTGQRHALAATTLVFAALSIGSFKLSGPPLGITAAGGAIVFALLWRWRMVRPPRSIDPAKPGPLLSLARAARTSPRAVAAYRYAAQTVLPAGFLLLSGLAILAVGHRTMFDLLSTGGAYCKATPAVRGQSDSRLAQGSDPAADGQSGADENVGLAPTPFAINSMCHATGLRLVAGRKYRIQLDIENGPDGEWFDQDRRVDVVGFAADSWRPYSATPLKRWWRENWFQPIARIGEVGNYEHVLKPAEPLPVVDFKACRPKREAHPQISGTIENIRTPATTDFKNKQLLCDQNARRRPNRTLISDITANATGELFLYVNDAILMLPTLTDMFYSNNSGKAKVTVTRIMADQIIPPTPGESVEAGLHDPAAEQRGRPRNN
jgi:uncharacterized protein (DUF2235 family)